MTHKLELTARSQADVMERILRVTRHRGFRVQSLNMRPCEQDSAHIRVQLDVESERELFLLTSQLDKLFDVINIENTASLSPSLAETASA